MEPKKKKREKTHSISLFSFLSKKQQRRAAAAAPSSEAGGGAGKLSQFGRVIEGPEGGQVVERKVLTRVGERVAEIERVQRVTTR